MTTEKITILNVINIHRNGDVGFQLASFYIENGAQSSESEYHRGVIEPGMDLSAVSRAVNENLLQIGKPELAAAEWMRLGTHCALAHTPEVIGQAIAGTGLTEITEAPK